MPRAEVGSNKYVANKMKSAGLQRLRWWCEICAKQCRDANGFKCHVQSESHVRQMQVVGENPQKYIKQFSDDFQHDFIALLRVAHGEKWINANKFYQQYIAAKEHVHMNATRWNSLTEFVKYLGREGIVRVRESESDKDKNMSMEIAWKDTSAAAVKRREEIREIELAEARSGAGEDKMLKKMARRAQSEADEKARILEARKAAKQDSASPLAPGSSTSPSAAPTNEKKDSDESSKDASGADGQAPVSAAPVKISFGLKAKALPPAQMKKTQSVFKRARGDKESEEKPKKKLKL